MKTLILALALCASSVFADEASSRMELRTQVAIAENIELQGKRCEDDIKGQRKSPKLCQDFYRNFVKGGRIDAVMDKVTKLNDEGLNTSEDDALFRRVLTAVKNSIQHRLFLDAWLDQK